VLKFVCRRLLVLLFAAGAAAAGWWHLPGTAPDQLAFETVARGFANPPFFVGGHGSQAEPWSLRTLASRPRVDESQAPFVVGIVDDPNQEFQSSPPSPLDMAVILGSLHRLGVDRVAISTIMAWEAPNILSLTGLEHQLRQFSRLLTTAPLSRGPDLEPIPPAFRNSSLPLSAVRGDLGRLPIVNRVPIQGLILGGENAWAGFSRLESEPAGDGPPLAAVWDDRVVLAFPLLFVLQRENLPISGVEIHLGHSLRLSPDGPTVLIDETGRMVSGLQSVAPVGQVMAGDLIRPEEGLLPETMPTIAVLRDDRSTADAATRGFSENLAGIIAAIASEADLTEERAFARLSAAWELAWLGLLAVMLAMAGGASGLPRQVGILLVMTFFLTAQWIGAGLFDLWLPVLPAGAATAAAMVVGFFLPTQRAHVEAAPAPGGEVDNRAPALNEDASIEDERLLKAKPEKSEQPIESATHRATAEEMTDLPPESPPHHPAAKAPRSRSKRRSSAKKPPRHH
jgi:hypothetical protein